MTRFSLYIVLFLACYLAPDCVRAISDGYKINIDATAPTKGRRWVPSSGSGSASDRKLPLQVGMFFSAQLSNPTVDHDLNVDFILTNSGNEPFILPILPDIGNIEPLEEHRDYTYKHLALLVVINGNAGVVLQGGADLYGDESVTGSLVTLAPKESIRVHARVRMRGVDGSDHVDSRSAIGRIFLSVDSVRFVSGQLEEFHKENGFVDSPPVPIAIVPPVPR